MLKVEEYGRIRRAHRDGMSIREIARTLGHSRRKIREALAQPEPRPYTLSQPRPRRVLAEAHQQWIDAILAADEQAPRKQRHTATHLFRRLRDEEQYVGGYDQVRRYVAARVSPLASITISLCRLVTGKASPVTHRIQEAW